MIINTSSAWITSNIKKNHRIINKGIHPHISIAMKYSTFVVFLAFSLLLVANLSCGTKDPGEYWKNMMKGEAMPEAIKELIEDPQAIYAGKDGFMRDFDVKPNAILYHTHVMSMEQN